MRLAQWRVYWLINIVPRIGFSGSLKIFRSEVRHCAKPENDCFLNCLLPKHTFLPTFTTFRQNKQKYLCNIVALDYL